MEQQETHKMVATKISIPAWRLFIRILHRVGLTAYDALQNFIDVFIRYGDDKHNLSSEMEVLMSAFEGCKDWDKQFNIADPTTKPEITEAMYFLRDKEKKGVRVLHVERPWLEGDSRTWKSTWNVQQILEKFLCLTFPGLYRRLQSMSVHRDCNSILELLFQVLTELESEESKKELRKPFEDASRSDWNRRQPGDIQYKIHHRRTPDDESMREAKQGTLDFDEPKLTDTPEYESPDLTPAPTYDLPTYDVPDYDSEAEEDVW